MNSSSLDLGAAEIAAKYINQTNKPVFLTGKAGTGKTTFLRKIIHHTHKNAIIVAPTGIAAINAGGVTIHSQFGIPFGLFIPDSSFKIESTQVKIQTPYTLVKHLNMREQKRRLLQELELLIIDEVSMLRADLLDTIDFVLKNIRRQQHKPFGGVQVLFIGDLLQLPPVVKEEEWRILRTYYNSIYFFDAKVLQNEKPVYIELDKIYRQSDNVFIDVLNNLRNNTVTKANVDLLNTYYKPNFDVTSALNTITLTTHNSKADELNRTALQKLAGKSHFFYATVEGEFSEYAYPVEANLELKVGAQIMFIKNDVSGKQQYFNGKIGVVSSLNTKEIEIDFKDGTKPFLLETHQWRNIKYELNPLTNEIDEKDIGSFVQYPIKLAWAITVHKSQGLTFEKAILDINRAFAPGQVYVALSRLKSLDGLILTSPIQFNNILQDKVLTDYTTSKLDNKLLIEIMDAETVTFLKSYLLRTYDFTWLNTSVKLHAESYYMAENKSNKQAHQKWAQDLFANTQPLKINADKFTNQLLQIFEIKQANYLNTIDERHTAAKNYFYPLLKNLSKSVLVQIELLKDEKQIKTYLEELLELEALFFKQIQLLDKASVFIDHVLHHKEFNKQSLVSNQTERLEIVRQSIAIAEKAAFEERKLTKTQRKTTKTTKQKSDKKPEKTKEIKEPKISTKEITYALFKEGKSTAEIVKARGLSITTIENHLAHYISLGMIPVTKLISKQKFDAIIECYKKTDSPNTLSAIKLELGEEYSFSDIRLALATQVHLKK